MTMPLIPQGDLAAMRGVLDDFTNARLLKITAPGPPAPNGDPGTGVDLWIGSAPCYLERVRHDEISGGAQVPVRQDVLTILADAAPVVEVPGPRWEASTLLVQDLRTAAPLTLTFRVAAMEHTAFGLLDSVRLELEETVA